MKKCSKCKVEKRESEFYRDRTNKNGLRSWCKICLKQYRTNNAEYYKQYGVEYKRNNAEHIKQQNVQYYKDNIDKIKQYRKDNAEHRKQYYMEYEKHNAEHLQQYRKEYRKRNAEHIKQYQSKYYTTNRDKIRIMKRRYEKQRRGNDYLFKLQRHLRKRLYSAIKNNYKYSSGVRDLGCNIEELKLWLEKQFQPGMTWENWGNGSNNWQIDHIIPFRYINIENVNEQKLVCHYKNLRPLWKKDNLSRTYDDIARNEVMELVFEVL